MLRADGLALDTHVEACCLLAYICGGGFIMPRDGPVQSVLAAHGSRAARAGLAGPLRALVPPLADYKPVIAERMKLLADALDTVPVRACDACGAADAPELKRCARCRKVHYCSVACQRAAWPQHKRDCVAAAAA